MHPSIPPAVSTESSRVPSLSCTSPALRSRRRQPQPGSGIEQESPAKAEQRVTCPPPQATERPEMQRIDGGQRQKASSLMAGQEIHGRYATAIGINVHIAAIRTPGYVAGVMSGHAEGEFAVPGGIDERVRLEIRNLLCQRRDQRSRLQKRPFHSRMPAPVMVGMGSIVPTLRAFDIGSRTEKALLQSHDRPLEGKSRSRRRHDNMKRERTHTQKRVKIQPHPAQAFCQTQRKQIPDQRGQHHHCPRY